jgi:hypothetical protein
MNCFLSKLRNEAIGSGHASKAERTGLGLAVNRKSNVSQHGRSTRNFNVPNFASVRF